MFFNYMIMKYKKTRNSYRTDLTPNVNRPSKTLLTHHFSRKKKSQHTAEIFIKTK
jgi:hypothetical protein